MTFPTIEFAAFFTAVLFLSWLLMPHPRAWRPFILVSSWVFYGWLDWRWVLLLVGSTVVNTVFANAVARADDQAARKRWVTIAVAANLTLLGIFKYLGFFVDSTDDALSSIGLGAPLPVLSIVLPIGISFYTFEAISYVVDVYRARPAAGVADGLRDRPGVLPAPRRRADRPRRGVPAAARRRRATRARCSPGRRSS